MIRKIILKTNSKYCRGLLFGVLILLCIAAPAFGASEFEERVITGITADLPLEITRKEFLELITFKEGDLYRQSEIRRSVSNLYLKGAFENIEVWAAPDNKEGVRLTFVLTPKLIISMIKVSGNDSYSKNNLLKYIRLAPGDRFVEAKIGAVTEKIKAAYAERGYYDAEATVTYYKDEKINKISLFIDIKENQRYLISSVKITGEPELAEIFIRARMRARVNGALAPATLAKDVERIRKFYLRNRFLDVEISPPQIELDRENKKGSVVFEIYAGYQTRIEFDIPEGKFSGRKLLKISGLKNEPDLTPAKLNLAAGNITDYLNKKGYYYARVNYEESYIAKKFIRSIKFNIDLKDKLSITSIEIKGNRNLTTKDIEKQMLTKARGISSRGYLIDSRLKKDLQAIEFLYKKKGFLKVLIEHSIAPSDKKDEIAIEINIIEGVRTRVETVYVSGMEIISDEVILKSLNTEVGEPLDLWTFEDDKQRILELYADVGHIYAEIESNIHFSPDNTKAFVHLDIKEGPLVKIGKIIIRGNTFTKTGIISRELEVKTGDTYVPREILKSQQRIYKLGLFQSVSLTPLMPEEQKTERDLILQVKGRNTGKLEVAPGYSTEKGVSLMAELSQKNLLGTGRGVILGGWITADENQVSLSYLEPWILDTPYDARVDFLRHVQRKEAQNYDLTNYQTIFTLSRDFTEYLTGTLQYDYGSKVINRIDPTIVLQGLEDDSLRETTIAASLTLDTRDDPFDPFVGTLDNVRVEVSESLLASEVEFVRITAQTNWYLPLVGFLEEPLFARKEEELSWHHRFLRKSVIGLSAFGGYIKPYGRTSILPIYERFDPLGGRDTLRGFEYQSVGPTRGGDKRFNYITELRFPLFWKLGGVVFHDGGDIWPEEEDIKLSDLRYSAGVGIRYLTIVGPLSLDYGINLDPEPGEKRSVWYFTFGHVF